MALKIHASAQRCCRANSSSFLRLRILSRRACCSTWWLAKHRGSYADCKRPDLISCLCFFFFFVSIFNPSQKFVSLVASPILSLLPVWALAHAEHTRRLCIILGRPAYKSSRARQTWALSRSGPISPSTGPIPGKSASAISDPQRRTSAISPSRRRCQPSFADISSRTRTSRLAFGRPHAAHGPSSRKRASDSGDAPPSASLNMHC